MAVVMAITNSKEKNRVVLPKYPPHPVYDERPKCQIERRKRNLIFISPVSRREREIQNNFSSFEKRKRILSRNFVGNLHFFSVSRRERKF